MSYPDPTHPAGRALAGATMPPALTEGVARRQGDAAAAAARDVDPQAWLFEQRDRYLTTGTCDPYAEQTLRLAGLLA